MYGTDVNIKKKKKEEEGEENQKTYGAALHFFP